MELKFLDLLLFYTEELAVSSHDKLNSPAKQDCQCRPLCSGEWYSKYTEDENLFFNHLCLNVILCSVCTLAGGVYFGVGLLRFKAPVEQTNI